MALFPIRNSYRYLLVIVDIFLRFVIVEPLKNAEKEIVVAALRRIFRASIYLLLLLYNLGTKFAIVLE